MGTRDRGQAVKTVAQRQPRESERGEREGNYQRGWGSDRQARQRVRRALQQRVQGLCREQLHCHLPRGVLAVTAAVVA